MTEATGTATQVTGAPAIWIPGEELLRSAMIADFARVAGERHGADLSEYSRLWAWSVANLGDFWDLVREYFGVKFHSPAEIPLADESMPGAKWFPGATLNYTEHVFGAARSGVPAVVECGEDDTVRETGWPELRRQVGALAATLRRAGVEPGDRVVGYLPNTVEAIVGFLATAAIGAVWATCGQDYAPAAALDRFAQLEPKVLLTADAHRFGGTLHDRRAAIGELREGLPTLAATIVVERLGGGTGVPGAMPWSEAAAGNAPLETVPVPFDHPLWILFSSGTTGKPKGIVHGHGGVLLEHLKTVRLQLDIGPGDRYLWYTTPSWMVWNLQASVLLAGATAVCFEGSPVRPTIDVLWSAAARCRVTLLGTSPGHLVASAKAGLRPGAEHDLSALRVLGSTGSALPATSFTWAADNVGAHVQVMSITGGTDVVSAFAGGSRTVSVWPGELSVPWLGVALDAWDDAGNSVRDVVGELVVTKPMPSMPVRFWNDPEGSRYREAYFERYPGIWRHGDWITVTSRGSVVVHGRSDSTLNRNGVRMGSADIYQAVEALPEIGEALVIGAEQTDGTYWMPLFVTLAPGYSLDENLLARINAAIREQVSARHVPDEIIEAPGVPHTRTGKKLEVPVKRLLQGAMLEQVVASGAVDDPELLKWYAGRTRGG